MAIIPKNLFDHGAALLESAASEEDLRASTNRSYYSVYHTARRVAESIPIPPAEDGGGSHAKLYKGMIACTSSHSKDHMLVKQIGYCAMRTLRPHRVRADYEIDLEFPKAIAEEAHEKAKNLLEKVALTFPA